MISIVTVGQVDKLLAFPHIITEWESHAARPKIMSFGIEITNATFRFTELVAKFLKRVRIRFQDGAIRLEVLEEERSVDDRIAMLDDAKVALAKGLEAIDELKREAEANKQQLQEAAASLEITKGNRAALEEEIQTARELLKSDVAAFRMLAGIPSKKEVRKERIIGFISGVFASILASLLVWLAVTVGTNIYRHYASSAQHGKA